MECRSIGCKFEKHSNIKNNGGEHCCLTCKKKAGEHGPLCQKKAAAAGSVHSDYFPGAPVSNVHWSKHPILFHKYIYGLSSFETPIKYIIIRETDINKKHICHIHIHDLNNYGKYSSYLDTIRNDFDIIITYNLGEKPLFDDRFTVLMVDNKGIDIGPKFCMLKFLIDKKIDYDYILFLHSKTNVLLRKKMFDALIKNGSRIKLLKYLMKLNNNLLGIFPDWVFQEGSTANTTVYFKEIQDFLNIKYRRRDFIAGNCMVLRREVIDRVFHNNLNIFYNILNAQDSFDLNWYTIKNKMKKGQSFEQVYTHYKSSLDKVGNNLPLMNTPETMPEGMIEHVFERIWLNVINDMKGDYIILSGKNAIDTYNIKINAIYFPQFHEIPENNKFWGNKFTEWTLLRPYEETIQTSFGEIPIYKPHADIGYYDLGIKETLLKQISIARDYNINGFIIYHYWFNKDLIVLNKPLEYFLSDDIRFPFLISWVNENWTRRWDGGNNEILLEQTYTDHFEHIHYLIPFFKRPNYIRNADNENIMYIYNIASIPKYSEMIDLWKSELDKQGLKLKIVGTNNSFPVNSKSMLDNTRFLFEPMFSLCKANFGTNKKEHSWSYEKLADNYLQDKISCPQKHPHFGLPLFWNNIVRRKNSNFHVTRDFNMNHLENFLMILLAKIILRFKNNINISKLPNYENFININAWNEWNEQAVLEPNNITGYETLETIKKIISDL